MDIYKNKCSFRVKGDYSEMWFPARFHDWESGTFHILEYYKNKTKGNIYIDVGAWIGPTVLYAANIYKKVIAIEPDPVAIQRLEENLSVNNYDNIVLIKKGLSDKNGKSSFGGNGELGNSESTLLVADKEYSSWENSVWAKEQRESNIIEIETITIETLLLEQNISPSDISLIKMDIEGGELFVVSALETFLKTYKPVFYISLHYCFLKIEHIVYIVKILFCIYENCYIFSDDGQKIKISIDDVLNSKLSEIVFE